MSLLSRTRDNNTDLSSILNAINGLNLDTHDTVTITLANEKLTLKYADPATGTLWIGRKNYRTKFDGSSEEPINGGRHKVSKNIIVVVDCLESSMSNTPSNAYLVSDRYVIFPAVSDYTVG